MGRAKIPTEYIQNAATRRSTYNRRTIGLKKKAYELSTLCDVPVCVVVFPEDDRPPWIYPEDTSEARSILDRYLSKPIDDGSGSGWLDSEGGRKKRRKLDAGESDSPIGFPNLLQCVVDGGGGRPIGGFGCETSDGGNPNLGLEGLSRDELVELGIALDWKMIAVQERINYLMLNC